MKLDLHMQIASYNILFDDEYVWRAISYRDSAGKSHICHSFFFPQLAEAT